jgi:hypothetical protein
VINVVDSEIEWKAKNLPYKDTVAAYGTAMACIPSQFSCDGFPKIHPGVAMTTTVMVSIYYPSFVTTVEWIW